MKTKASRKSLNFLLLVLTFATSLIQVAHAAPGPDLATSSKSSNQLEGKAVERRDLSVLPVLEGSWVELHQGTFSEDGDCVYSGTGVENDGTGRVGVERLIAVNRETCEYEVEKGFLSSLPEKDTSRSLSDYDEEHVEGSIPCPPEEEATDKCPTGSDSGSIANGYLALLAPASGINLQPARYSHHNLTYMFATVWEDPEGIEMALVRTAVRTHTSGETMTSADCSRYRRWADWWNVSNTPPFDYYACEFGGYYIAVGRSGHFYTDAFRPGCGFVHIYIDSNFAEGRLTYGYGWLFNTWVSGGWCKSLLWWTNLSAYNFYPASLPV
jgi:hypothetical protein